MSHLIPILTVALAGASITGTPREAPTGPTDQVYDPTIRYEHRHDLPGGEKLLYVESQLRCDCGCSLDVHLCQFQMQCGTSPVWSERILEELQAGASEETVLAGFVADYGQTVLMAPPARGFNWLGYLLPPAALIMGGILVGLFLRGRGAAAAGGGPAPNLDSRDWEVLQEELRMLEEDTDW